MQKFKKPEAEVKWQLIMREFNNKLSCREEAARCTVSLKLLSFGRSLKVIRIYSVE